MLMQGLHRACIQTSSRFVSEEQLSHMLGVWAAFMDPLHIKNAKFLEIGLPKKRPLKFWKPLIYVFVLFGYFPLHEQLPQRLIGLITAPE